MTANRLTCVNDRAPGEIADLLRAACADRDVEYADIAADAFDYDPSRQLSRGDLLYRSGPSQTALRVEQFLYGAGVATFYAGVEDRPFFVSTTQPLHFERAGLPVPKTLYCASGDRALLNAWVERLGGFPLLAQMGAAGKVVLESHRALYSFVDYSLAIGRLPILTPDFEDALRWRVVVVGDRAVTAYADPPLAAHAPAAIRDLAAEAVKVLQLEFGGVDLIQRGDECLLIEANFPCDFASARNITGVDVAGAMLDHLLRKAAASRSGP